MGYSRTSCTASSLIQPAIKQKRRRLSGKMAWIRFVLILSIAAIAPLETAEVQLEQLPPSPCVIWMPEGGQSSTVRSYYSYSHPGLGVVNRTGPALWNNASRICYDLVGITANETVKYYFEHERQVGGNAKCANISFNGIIGAEIRLVSY